MAVMTLARVSETPLTVHCVEHDPFIDDIAATTVLECPAEPRETPVSSAISLTPAGPDRPIRAAIV